MRFYYILLWYFQSGMYYKDVNNSLKSSSIGTSYSSFIQMDDIKIAASGLNSFKRTSMNLHTVRTHIIDIQYTLYV